MMYRKEQAVPGIDPPSRFAFRPSWRTPTLVIAVVGTLAFVLWTLPNWNVFWSNVSQFPGLWQLPANRRIIISLILKVTSPLLFLGITGIMFWVYALMKSSDAEEAPDAVRHQHLQPHALATQRVAATMVAPASHTGVASWSSVSRTRPAAGSPAYNPETPLPSTLSLVEALRREAEESLSPPLLSEAEQAELLADASRKPLPAGAPRAEAPQIQLAPSTHLAAWVPEGHLSADPLISIRLLKDVSIMINVPGGGQVVVPLTMNAKRVQLLAYIAWRRGDLIDRDKIMEHVFGWGLEDEEATEEKLAERFESHKKLLRKKIRDVVVEQINKPAGRQVIDPEIDPFISDSGFWGLSDLCRVEDIEAIESSYQVISLARKDGKLIDEVPEYIHDACEQLIAHYPGDFLDSLIKKYPSEFHSWQGRSSWTRKPYTHYRDYYLDALWYAAEYEWRMGHRSRESERSEPEEARQRKQQEHFGRAAQRYQSYAIYACNSKFDAKVTFGAHGEFGERIGMSERAIRRCVVLLGAIGRTDLVNQVWSSYYTKMKSISDQRWQPSKETQADVQAAREQTSAYRFAAQVSQWSSAFAEKQERVS